MEFNFTVRGDKITADKDYSFTEGNKGSYVTRFDFDENWQNLVKICIVENEGDCMPIAIINDCAELPLLEKLCAKIGVIGIEVSPDEKHTVRMSTNMEAIGVNSGAASSKAIAKLETAAEVWEVYLADMENNRKAAEKAAAEAVESEGKALEAQENSENFAKNAGSYEDSARQYAEASLSAKNESVNALLSAQQASKSAMQSAQTAENAKSESILARDAAVEAKEGLETAEGNAKDHAADAKTSADNAAKSEENAKASEEAVAENKAVTEQLAKRAETAAENAEESEVNSAASRKSAEQALSDLLAMINSGDIVLATGGKLPLSSIPATATQEIYVVESEDELTSLTAQRGDLAELVEEIDGERTITKTWQCLGDASIRDSWVVWGTSYAVQAGNSTTANNAQNANMINNHRIVEMTEEEFSSAVKDADTYYLVY